jgi:hypothetical protein
MVTVGFQKNGVDLHVSGGQFFQAFSIGKELPTIGTEVGSPGFAGES